jgi:ABC-type nitrate/sulfonate/bicarbonate transport system substrate-binding protein
MRYHRKSQVRKATGTGVRFMALLAVLALAIAACGNGAETTTTALVTTTTADAATTTAAGGGETTTTETTTTAAAAPEMTAVRLAFQTPDFSQIANFKFVEDLRAAGVEVEFVEFEDQGTLMRALVAEEVDFAISSAITSVIRLSEATGEKIRILAADIQAADYVLVAQTDIADLAAFIDSDLTVGISTPGDISDTLTRYVFQQAGFDDNAVNFVQVGGTSARMTAILNGQLDAGPAHAAEGITAADQGGMQILARYGEFIPNYQQHGLMASDDVIAANPVLIQLMVDLFIDSVRWAADSREDYIALATEELEEGFTPEVMNQAYDVFEDIGLFAINGGMEPDLLAATVEVEQAVGSLTGDIPPMEEWTEVSFVEDYLARNGTR